jgi:hypothetical protein
MPDPQLIASAAVAAALVAAVVMLVGVWPARKGRMSLATLVEVLAVGGGIVIGCRWLGIEPRLSLAEDQDRLLVVILPVTGVVEILAAFFSPRAWIGQVLRVLWSLCVPALLLLGSGWLPAAWLPIGEPSAPSSWTSSQAIGMLAALGVALALLWGLLIRAAERPGGFAVPAALGLVTTAAGVSVMLSGSASGGLIGLPFAGIAAGVLVVCLLFARMRATTGLAGVGIILLFGVLVDGRFFGKLTTTNFVLLLAAPLLSCVGGIASLARFRAVPRFVGLVILALLPAGVAAGLAYRTFAEETDTASAYSGAASASSSSRPAASSAASGPAPTNSTVKTTAPQDPGADEPAPASGSGAKTTPAPVDPAEESKN